MFQGWNSCWHNTPEYLSQYILNLCNFLPQLCATDINLFILEESECVHLIYEEIHLLIMLLFKFHPATWNASYKENDQFLIESYLIMMNVKILCKKQRNTTLISK